MEKKQDAINQFREYTRSIYNKIKWYFNQGAKNTSLKQQVHSFIISSAVIL